MADLFYMIVVSVIVIFVGYVLYIVDTGIISGVETAINATESEQVMFDNAQTSQSILVEAVPIIIIVTGLSAVMSALFIPSHPIFMPISVLALIFFEVLAAIFGNVMWEFLNNSSIITTANQYPVLLSLVQHYPLVVGIIGTLLIIVMYSFRRRSNNE